MTSLKDINFNNKKALVRVDFNVPLNDALEVTDVTRIQAAKPTLIKILEDGGSAIIVSHLGRPKGKEDRFSLKHIIPSLEEVLGVQVQFIDDCIGEEVEKKASNLQAGQILLLENLRFYPEEKQGDSVFAHKLASIADIYVNDAFGTAHRAHASTTVVAQYFNENKCFGFLLEKEIKSIEKVLHKGESPIVAVLGGAKVSSKITIIENMLKAVDHIIVGGGMAYTFIKALKGNIGSSICEDDKLALALEILDKAKKQNVEIHLPVDVIAADDFSNDANQKVVDAYQIPQDWQGLDAGPRTLENFDKVIQQAKTILWNGPLGVFEFQNFSKGTISLGDSIAKATQNGAFSLVGGGDSVAAVKQFGFENKVSYVSTGGGAMLESLEGKTLPGIAAILSSQVV